MKVCAIEDCGRKHYCRGFCTKHYDRLRRHGDPTIARGARNEAFVNNHGYRQVKVPGHPVAFASGWALEHRVVAWDTFGPFPLDNHVHHINHDKLDNRPENLAFLTPEEHRAEHRVVDRAEVVRLYLGGMSTLRVGKTMGINPGTVSRVLAAEGVKARPAGEGSRVDVDCDEIRRLHGLPGMRADRMARHLNVSTQVVRARMKELGLPPFPTGRPSPSEGDPGWNELGRRYAREGGAS